MIETPVFSASGPDAGGSAEDVAQVDSAVPLRLPGGGPPHPADPQRADRGAGGRVSGPHRRRTGHHPHGRHLLYGVRVEQAPAGEARLVRE